MADLLGSDFSLAESHRLYECHDKLLEQLKMTLPEQAPPKIYPHQLF